MTTDTKIADKALAKHSRKGDTVVIISSSGMSPNIIKGGCSRKKMV